MLKKLFLVLASILIVLIGTVGFLFFQFSQNEQATFIKAEFSLAEEMRTADLKLGERMYHVRSGCVECHGSDLSGAMIMDNPAMGTIHGANLTPFNLKDWTDEDIARAIRYGQHRTGRSLKFMPSFDYEGISKQDLASLVAYIRSVAPVEKPNYQNQFGPVAKIMSVLGKMPIMFPAKIIDPKKTFNDKPEEAATADFGKYLANSCIGCHGHEFRGGKIAGGDPNWPEASSLRLGANSAWTEETFKATMLSGISPLTKKELRAPMPVALTKQFNDVEIKALWEYLKDLK